MKVEVCDKDSLNNGDLMGYDYHDREPLIASPRCNIQLIEYALINILM
jgi:hypothetical protein